MRLALLALVFPVFVAAAEFVDPAPPVVAPLKATEAPAPQAQAELAFVRAPAPLAKEAKTVDSPGFLGESHSPVSAETHLKDDLKGLSVVWETEKGTGYSAPAVAGGRLILFHRLKDEEVVDCLQPETGRRYWRFTYPTEYRDRYNYTNGPRCTPVIDVAASLVFTFGAEGRLLAVDLKTGQCLSKRDIPAEFQLGPYFFGVGATPLVEKDMLIVNVGAKGACVVGFDTKTGKARWAAPAPKDWGPSYASPIPSNVHGLRRVFVFAGGESVPATGGLLCVDPASGAVDFSFSWRGRRVESVNASSPLIVDDKVFISECYGKGGTLLELSAEGGKLAAKPLWETDKLCTHFMTALPLNGHLYGCDGHGPANCPIVCIDMKSGEEKWRSEPDLSEDVTLPDGSKKTVKFSTDRCHLLYADGRTLCLSEWGHLAYLELTPAGCKVVSRRWLFAVPQGETWSVPVLSRGLLYVNQNNPDPLNKKGPRLICYDLRK
jgi:outer membrane protein assembly factor BamB